MKKHKPQHKPRGDAKAASPDPTNPGPGAGNSMKSPTPSAQKSQTRSLVKAQTAVLIHEEILLREDAVRLRELAASMREQAISATELLQAQHKDRLVLLQDANAQLVTATLKAEILTERAGSANDALDHQAHHDALTGLPNRVLLLDRLEQAMEAARRQGRQLAVMFMDLDHFKHINDTLGHAVGDKLLQAVAQRLVACVRRSDTISRQGGDEFIAVLSYIEHAEDAACSAKKLLASLNPPYKLDSHELKISASIGISIYPDDGEDASTLINSADTALYAVKHGGRSSYKFFEQKMNARAQLRQSMEADLRRALAQDEFLLYYQPKVNLRTRTIIGVEALLRWQHPTLGLLLPEKFLSIAEDCALILPIGRWVLRTACQQAQAWRQAGLPSMNMAVNISSLEFRSHDFLDHIKTTLAQTDWNPANLELEMTERVLMREGVSTEPLLQALAEMGIQLAVDDFGTGLSSVSHLQRFPVHTLKIDRSFIHTVDSHPDDACIVTAQIQLGKNLSKRVMAEGVETSAQLAWLQSQHCEEGQGYYFGPAMQESDFANVLKSGLSLPQAH